MSPQKTIIVIFATLFAALLRADDFKTINGKEYKNASVTRVEPDGIVIKGKSGIVKLYFSELPKDVQERFHYDPQKGAEFTSRTIEEIKLSQQQEIEAGKKRSEEIARNLERVRQQEEAEMQRQHEAKMQRQQLQTQQQRQVRTQPTYSRSQEGLPEYTYELTQDYKIDLGGITIRLRRGERYRGRILVDHAEIDRDGKSYTVPSGILRRIN